ncbi:hypothetical protein I317_02960 [Kwoniella heveanensis CBS 569]|uniref:Uncharacterized protein n=1 Tax=Kwoniella heveanensis BCC8398 TaxID=1296120 RepID=A0A1B9GLB5_9TREE|nr:hypothetical protein I316_06458 [Kwoniella heveanensis BCC8398]OCF43250.1 hypothetical protein I317_02960 [Kwoniella heveanensis CBS 569]
MQLPSTTLFLVLFSLASAGLSEAASSSTSSTPSPSASHKPPATYSPDYKQCKNGVKSDPSCVPVTSDEEVAYLRSTGRRFKLLNEKRPDLKPIHASASRAAAAAASATAGSMVAPGLLRPELNYPNGDGSGNDNGKSAPSYVVIQQRDQDLSREKDIDNQGWNQGEDAASSSNDADSIGNRKYGFGSGGWGRPYIKRDTNDFAFPAAFSGSSSSFANYWNWNSPSLGFTSGTGTGTPSTGTALDIVSTEAILPVAPTAEAAVADTTADQTYAIASTPQLQDLPQSSSQNKDSTGNAKWGFGSGGWGRPWRRAPSASASPEDGSALDNCDIASDDVIVPIATSIGTGKEDTGNMKWGFGSGGWGRPFRRADVAGEATRSCVPQVSTSTGALPVPAVDVQPYSYPAVAAEQPSQPSTYDTTSPAATSQSVDDLGNKKWGFGSGGWGRPFARSALEYDAPPAPPSQEENENADDMGNRKYGFGSGGWGRPF